MGLVGRALAFCFEVGAELEGSSSQNKWQRAGTVQGQRETPSAEKSKDPGYCWAQGFEAGSEQGLELVLRKEMFKIKKPGRAVPPLSPNCGGHSVVLS